MGVKYEELDNEEARVRKVQYQKEKDPELHEQFITDLGKSFKEQDNSLDVTKKVPHLEFPAIFEQKACEKEALRLGKTGGLDTEEK